MGYIITTFLGKEYSIPEDVIAYVDLVDFTNEIRDALMASFRRKIRTNIDVIESDDFMIADLSEQASKFVRKLLDNDVYNRTTNDYFQNNKGYDLFIDTKKKILRQLLSIRKEKLETYRAGVEDAIHRKESSVTGLDFGIISSSFVNHMIYAYMDASKQTKQEKEALKTYNREIAELDKQAAEYDRQENSYVSQNVIPAMNTVFTFFAYELLDKYVSDLIKAGKFDKVALDYIDLERSNDLLKNLGLSNKRTAILESAFVACPFNIAVYMHALKYDLLDYDSFQTAKVFKQDHHVLSFFRESWGEVSFPTKFNINYHCINVWASITGKSSADLLRSLTEQYATGIVKAYARVADMMANKATCRKIIGDCSEDAIIAGDEISKAKAHSYVDSVVSTTIWSQLTEKCGHQDLLDRIKKCIPLPVDASRKEEYDKYLVEQLFSVLEAERIVIAAEIKRQREVEAAKKAEHEKQAQERKKRNKRIVAIVTPVIVAAFIFVIVLNSIIIPNKNYNEAVSLMNDGKYEEAIAAFEAMDGYKDSSDKIEECYAAILDAKYIVANELMHNGQYNDAISAFEELQGHLDSEAKIEECRYAIALALMNQEKYSEAISVFELISGYKDSEDRIQECNAAVTEQKYIYAVSLMNDGKYEQAISTLEGIINYKDSKELIDQCEDAILQAIYEDAINNKHGTYIPSESTDDLLSKYITDNNFDIVIDASGVIHNIPYVDGDNRVRLGTGFIDNSYQEDAHRTVYIVNIKEDSGATNTVTNFIYEEKTNRLEVECRNENGYYMKLIYDKKD